MRLQIVGDSLLIEGTLGKRKIRGVAIHPMATHHPKEWATVRKYLDVYLEKAAPTLIGKPLYLDHQQLLLGCKVIEARWNPEMSRLEYVAEATEDVADKISKGLIKSVSVGIDWQMPGGGILATPEGVIPYNFSFAELSLLEYLSPGDPVATVQLWEGITTKMTDLDSMRHPVFARGVQIIQAGGTFDDALKYLDRVTGLPETMKMEIRKAWYRWVQEQAAVEREAEERRRAEAEKEAAKPSSLPEPRTLAQRVKGKLGW